MHSGRTVVAILVVLCGLTPWPRLAAAQTLADVGGPGRPGAPVQVAGVIVPPSALQPAGRPARHLFVDEAVTLALEHNLDLRVERLNPQIQDLSIAEARSVYAPTLATTFETNSRNTPSPTIFAGGDVKVTNRLLSDRVNVVQEVPLFGAP